MLLHLELQYLFQSEPLLTAMLCLAAQKLLDVKIIFFVRIGCEPVVWVLGQVVFVREKGSDAP